MSSRTFLSSVWFSTCRICNLGIETILLFHCDLESFTFSCVIALASTFTTMLNKRERVGMLAFFRIFKKKLFPINYNASCGLFTYGLYCV